MRAVVITRPGGPEVLEIRQVSDPVPASGEVLVHVRGSALNRADLLQREGRYPAPPGAPADIPGLELAGEVAALGSGVTRWRVGDRVFGVVGGGGQAELAVSHADALAAIPGNLSWDEAAAVPEVFITAHDALITQARLQPRETVLIHAVTSGVGLAAVQLVRAFGGRSFGTIRSESKVEALRPYVGHGGLVDVANVRDGLEMLRSTVPAWTNDRGMDVVLDLAGGPYLEASIQAAALEGRIILIGTMAGRTATISLGPVLGKRLTIRGTVLRARSLDEKIAATNAFERDVVPLLARGDVRPTIDSVYAMTDIAAAHERMASNENVGKIVLRW